LPDFNREDTKEGMEAREIGKEEILSPQKETSSKVKEETSSKERLLLLS
jgi:hypothetical protein